MTVPEGATPEVRAEVRSQRRLFLIAGTTYLVWWFAVEAILPGSYNPLAGRLVVVAFFFAGFAASFAPSFAGRPLDLTLTAGVWLLTAHYFHLVHRNAGAMPWAVGAYIVVVAAGALLRSRWSLLGYSAFALTLAVFVALLHRVLLHSIFLPGLATMLALSNYTVHTRTLLEQERSERVRADARRMAAEASVTERDDFIAIASHELYTPLTALQLTIQGLSNTLRQDASASGSDVLERVERCRRHVNRLTRLVDELLSASRIGAGKLSLRLEPVGLGALVRDVADLLAGDALRAKSEIVVSGDAQVIVECDRLRIEQVVTNLLRNALIYGAGKPVRASVVADGACVRLVVADDGIGVAPDDQARIFGRFERAVSTTQYGGMGLGLYITKQIVDAHGGTIRVESEPGRGATFVVELTRAAV